MKRSFFFDFLGQRQRGRQPVIVIRKFLFLCSICPSFDSVTHYFVAVPLVPPTIQQQQTR
jgi:hypothetical protein